MQYVSLVSGFVPIYGDSQEVLLNIGILLFWGASSGCGYVVPTIQLIKLKFVKSENSHYICMYLLVKYKHV